LDYFLISFSAYLSMVCRKGTDFVLWSFA
jgi:hypothetical protein